jgi:hypothetical protein
LEALVQIGIHHGRHGEHFPAGTEDAIWLPFVGQKRLDPAHERQAYSLQRPGETGRDRYQVREFYFTSGNFSGAEMAALLVSAWPEMLRVCKKHRPPFIASLTKAGNVYIRLGTDDDSEIQKLKAFRSP